MNQDDLKFVSELDRLLRTDRQESETTAQLVDEAGFAINLEIRKMESLEAAMDRRATVAGRLAERLLDTVRPLRASNPAPHNPDPLGRDIGPMPRVVSRHAQQAPHTPPPIPAGSEFSAHDYDQAPRRAGRGF